MRKIDKKILKIVTKNNPKKKIKLKVTDNILNIGINSINFIKIITQIENQYGIVFDDDYLDLSRYQNISDLIEYIERKIIEK